MGEECEVFSVGKENENPGITTHDPVMGVTNWRLEEEDIQLLDTLGMEETKYAWNPAVVS